MTLLESLIITALITASLFLGVHIGNKTRAVGAKASKSCYKLDFMECAR